MSEETPPQLEAVIEARPDLHTLTGASLLLEQGQRALAGRAPIVVDLGGSGAIGSNGAAALLGLKRAADGAGLGFTLRGLSPAQIEELQRLPAPHVLGKPDEPETSLLYYLGTIAAEVVDQAADFFHLMADTLYWAARRAVGSGPWRQGQFIRETIAIGNEGLPIVAVVATLVGLVTAFQAADQLRQFGADIFIADLVGLGVLREMGPLITAILVAGRSGSAMAAELGTMSVEEEIDALRVMGIDPIPFLVVPKAYATLVAVPALTALGNFFGILGGYLIAVFYLQLAPAAFFTEFLTAVDTWDVMTGMIKSVLFAIVIVVVGCHFGLRLRGGAEEVGRAATSAVVASLFLIILVDGVYVTVETLIT